MLKLEDMVTVYCYVCGKKSEYAAEHFDCVISTDDAGITRYTYTLNNDCFCGVDHSIRFIVLVDTTGAIQNIFDESRDCCIKLSSLKFTIHD